MTDEEIEKEAKKYSQGNFYSEQGFIYGYELGLAEGKPKWHDLRKDPNDLPKEIQLYSNPVYVISRGGSSDLAQYDYRQHMWCYKYSNEHILYEVIAWCELPKFEE